VLKRSLFAVRAGEHVLTANPRLLRHDSHLICSVTIKVYYVYFIKLVSLSFAGQ